ncbi:MAG: hypothetical protein K6C10_00810 [Prevotella sp.]|nr:hypothetical protein [Prevotella sp.]
MTKRFTLCLVAIFMMVATGLAQTSQQRVVKMPEKMAKLVKTEKTRASKAVEQRQMKKSEKQRFARQMFSMNKKAQKANAQKPMRKAYGDPLIEEQPEGEFVSYIRNGESYVATFLGLMYQEVIGGAVQAVFANDGTVYLKNLLTGFECPGWVKGQVDGSKITIEFPQTILESEGEYYYLELMELDMVQETYVAKEDETLVLDYDPATRAISTPANSPLATGENVLGLTDYTSEWYGYADWNFSMEEVNIEPVSAPEGLETTEYVLQADDYAGHLVNVGFDGNDVYVQGVYTELPESWIKGTINGDKVIFKTGQYIGATTYHQYLVAATAEEVYDEYYDEYYEDYVLADEDITFDYDAATKTLSNSNTFMVNAGTETVYYAAVFEDASMAPFVEVPATPAAPDNILYTYMGYPYYALYGYGWGYLEYEIQPVDEEGNFILSDKLSYHIYTRVNGEEKVLEFDPETFIALEEPMTEIPYGFTEGWDIYENAIYLYQTGVDAYGMQTIYRGGGEERRSEIVWVETGVEPQPEKETPEYPELDPENVGNSINYSPFDGSQEVGVIGDLKTQTYDVAMKLQDDAIVGTHIDKISIPLVSTENVSNLKVWLSTNLRVENGVNAPNLVEIPTEASESGFVTVELPTPYTIPEEGVYVGYSMTIDEVDDYTGYPIVVVDKMTEGGLYLHTSKVYMKWMDMSEEIGVSAYIKVEVSGASVKDNAAAPKANETTYVKAGEEITVETMVANHGAKGIESLDVNYILNGKTTSKHFDLAEPVANDLGLTCTITNTLEGIAERGNYDLVVKVVKVNGIDNEDVTPESTSPIVVLNNIPKKRALLEEYTGTWCGWCVRGFVAFEKLAELYPDEYVLVSYHNGDPMEVVFSNEYPSTVEGYPDAWIDRAFEVDPYYGLGDEPMGVAQDLADRNQVFGYADIDVKANLSADEKKVSVTTNVTFPYDATGAKYGLSYVLVADGMTGTGSDWSQSNYYNGEVGLEDDLAPFADAGDYVDGLVYNDVAVMVSAKSGAAIRGSIPATITADKAISHKYTFLMANAINNNGDEMDLDVEKLKVVAILTNTETGEVLNAQKCKVATATAIKIADEDQKTATPVVYYDLGGRQAKSLHRGLNIVRMSDGTVRKVLKK